jgi:hypothetical protein
MGTLALAREQALAAGLRLGGPLRGRDRDRYTFFQGPDETSLSGWEQRHPCKLPAGSVAWIRRPPTSAGFNARSDLRMQHSRQASARSGRTTPLSGSAEIGAMVARTAPAIIELLGDGTARSKNRADT